MHIDKLFITILKNLEEEAVKKFESKEAYFNWNQRTFKEKGYKVYGLKVPEIAKILKIYIKQFKDLSFDERVKLSRKFYKSDYIAHTSFGLKLLEICLPQLTPSYFNLLDEICGYLSDWGPTDSFSLYIMQPLLRKYPNEVKRLLKKWNQSDYLWKKRTSVVVFTRKIGVECEFIDFLLELCDNIIWDKEDLVRKGIGWALKDNMVGRNKQKVINYVKKLRKSGISSTITLYAIRKLKGKEREEVLRIKPEL